MSLTKFLLDSPYGHHLTRTENGRYRTLVYTRDHRCEATADTFDRATYEALRGLMLLRNESQLRLAALEALNPDA